MGCAWPSPSDFIESKRDHRNRMNRVRERAQRSDMAQDVNTLKRRRDAEQAEEDRRAGVALDNHMEALRRSIMA